MNGTTSLTPPSTVLKQYSICHSESIGVIDPKGPDKYITRSNKFNTFIQAFEFFLKGPANCETNYMYFKSLPKQKHI